MTWDDLRSGDVLIDLKFKGNDHILLTRDSEHGTWLNVTTGAIRLDLDTSFNDSSLDGWEVIRGGETVWPKPTR